MIETRSSLDAEPEQEPLRYSQEILFDTLPLQRI
jgi:hypothetical protein